MATAAARDERALVHEARARQIKACRIADVLLARGCTDPGDVRGLRDDDRRMIEKAAGVRESSLLVWEQAAVLVDHARHAPGGPVPLDLY